jgi:ABC-type transporter Mla subunit MlaD
MQSSRVERPEQLAVEVGRWSVSVTTIAVTVVFVIVVGMFANSTRKNNDRAEDWRRRAVAAEEVVGGLRVVLADRSRALNQRTRQANELIDTLASNRGALRQSKVSLGALSRRQRQLASDRARAETERRKLQARQAALASATSALNACSQGLEAFVGSGKKPTAAARQSRLEQCSRAQARYRAYLQAG